MALNVTTAVFGENCNTATASPSLVQWDKGQVLQLSGLDLPDAYQVEFSTVYTRNAIPMIGNASGVQVPNELLQRSAPITACIVLHGSTDSRETEYWVTIHITPRKPPETTTPDPEQEDALDQAIAALEAGAAKAEAAAEAIQDMGVEAETLAEGSPASVEKTIDPETGAVTLSFGLPKGAKGNPGNPGADGTTPNFRIGTVTTLPPESPAEATITGTPAQPVLNLGIPQGEKGEPGGGSGTSDYTQLSNKPQINGHTLSGNQSAADLGLGTYSKPASGIPKTDLASDVQASLGKADTALQTAPVQSVAGKTGAVNLGAGDVAYSNSENYDSGTVGHEVSELSRQLSDLEDSISDAYDATASYAVGDFCINENTLYRCNTAIPTGGEVWTPAHWDAVQIVDLLGSSSGDVTDVQINGTSILSDGVANIPIATNNAAGVARGRDDRGISATNGWYQIACASTALVKSGDNLYKPIVSSHQHESAFYGLAKAAGDATQSASANAVGTYTEDAKSAIHEMLNGAVTVSGMTPSITAKSGITYVCGEVATLDITPPASGIFDVIFQSGSTPTVLTATGVTWMNGFDPTVLEANKTYEINILNGLGVAAWT